MPPESTPTKTKPALAAAVEAAAGQLGDTELLRPHVRLRLQNKGGSSSVTVLKPTGYDKAMLNDAVNRLVDTDLNWIIGSPDVVEPGADSDQIGTGEDAVKMVAIWTQ